MKELKIYKDDFENERVFEIQKDWLTVYFPQENAEMVLEENKVSEIPKTHSKAESRRSWFINHAKHENQHNYSGSNQMVIIDPNTGEWKSDY